MKKRILSLVMSLCLVLGLCACGGSVSVDKWQDQYDLGVRYLSEGNYQEAIIAFTAAIDIDPRRPEAYIGLADVYTAQGDFSSAAEVLSGALEAVEEDEEILDILEQLESRDTDASGAGSRTERFDMEDGSYYIYEYDADGFEVRCTFYNAAGTAEAIWEYENDADGNRIRQTDYSGDGTLLGWHLYEYDSNGNLLSESYYSADGSYSIYEYDADGFEVRSTLYNAAGTAEAIWEYEYDADGNRIRQTDYSGDGTLLGWHLYEHDSNGNLLGESIYSADGTLQCVTEVDPERHQAIRLTWYNEDGTVRSVEEYTG